MKATFTEDADARARHDMLKAMHDRVSVTRFTKTSNPIRGIRLDEPSVPNLLGRLASALATKTST